jgi:hypothetical protein
LIYNNKTNNNPRQINQLLLKYPLFLSLIASPLPITKNAFSGLLSLPLIHNPNSVSELHHLPDANKLLLTLAENIDLERIGNLVIEEVNVS